MSQINIQIDPLTTNCVLKNLGLAIDEIKLVRSINSIYEQVSASEEVSSNKKAAELESGRHRYLISELRFLNKRLKSVRAKADNS
jgi:hypothetical protein